MSNRFMKEFKNHKKVILLPLTCLIVIYSLFVFLHHKKESNIAENRILEHAQIVSDDLWNFNVSSAEEYLKLAAKSDHYKSLVIYGNNEEKFYETITSQYSWSENIGLKLHLTKKTNLAAVIQYEQRVIGKIEAIWIPQTIFLNIIVLTFLLMCHLVFFLYQQVRFEKRSLEVRVANRTADLVHQKSKTENTLQHLKMMNAEVQALLDNSPVGILCVDFNRIIQRVNPEISRITGYDQEELIGHTTQKLYATEGEFYSHGETNYPILLRDGFCQVNAEIRKKDGKKVICYWRGRVIDQEGGKQGVVWSLEDISLRLKMEEDILKVRKLESVGVLAGGIAHDFNNILVAIIGNISLAEHLTAPDDKVLKLLTSAKKASLRAKDLTTKLLTFASGGEPVRSVESLPELLEESTLFVLSGSNVKCQFDFPGDIWPINMDKAQINQVIQNLVVNADQAMVNGGVLRISCQNTKGSTGKIPGLKDDYYVKVIVQDSGFGIPPEEIGKIFDPFFSTKVKDANKGSGLGLSIVHSVISKHDGVISVDSKIGKGTTFTIYLPASVGEIASRDLAQETLVKGKGRILVMDDEEIIRNVVTDMLNYIGYDVVTAKDGSDAVDLYDKSLSGKRIDLLILDLTVPGGMGGEETMRKLLEINPNVIAIVSSGYSQDPILDNYKEKGFYNMLRKPYQMHEVSNVLEKTLRK